jgi:hypothetical protein
MKKYILTGLISLLPCFVSAGNIQVSVNGESSSQVECFVSCPSENGFPDVPSEYQCDELPEIGTEFTVIVKAIEKTDMQDVIYGLQVMAGIRK